jgi:hypothetical protein
MAACRGHETADGRSWTFDDLAARQIAREMPEWRKFADQIKQIDPTLENTPESLASVIDQLECRGLNRDEAIQNLINMTKRAAALKASRR